MASQITELRQLSGSTDGKQIKITQTVVGSAQTIHTATAVSGAFDLIWLYAFNSDSVSRTVTILWGGTTSPDDYIVHTIPAGERLEIHAGDMIANSLIVKAFASVANVVMLSGQVERVQSNST